MNTKFLTLCAALISFAAMAQPMQRNVITTNPVVAAGANVTISAAGGTVTISSTGGSGGGQPPSTTLSNLTSQTVTALNLGGGTNLPASAIVGLSPLATPQYSLDVPLNPNYPSWTSPLFQGGNCPTNVNNIGSNNCSGIAIAGTNIYIIYNSGLEIWNLTMSTRVASNYCVPDGYEFAAPNPGFCGGKIFNGQLAVLANDFTNQNNYTQSGGTYIYWFNTNTLALNGITNLNNTTGYNIEDFLVYNSNAYFCFWVNTSSPWSSNFVVYSTNNWTSNNIFALSAPIQLCGGMDFNPITASAYVPGFNYDGGSTWNGITPSPAFGQFWAQYGGAGQNYLALNQISMSNGVVTPVMQYYNPGSPVGDAGVGFLPGGYTNIYQVWNYGAAEAGVSNNLMEYSLQSTNVGAFDYPSGFSYRYNLYAHQLYADNVVGYGEGLQGIGAEPNFISDSLQNTSIGRFGGESLDSSSLYNTFAGYGAGWHVTGIANTAIGDDALSSAAPSIWNVAIGASALASVTTGNSNIAVGTEAGFNLTTGCTNIYIGAAGNANDMGEIYIGTPGTHTNTTIAGVVNTLTNVNIAGNVLIGQSATIGVSNSAQAAQITTGGLGMTITPGGTGLTNNGNLYVTNNLVVSNTTTVSNLLVFGNLQMQSGSSNTLSTNWNHYVTNLYIGAGTNYVPYTNYMGTAYAEYFVDIVLNLSCRTNGGQPAVYFVHRGWVVTNGSGGSGTVITNTESAGTTLGSCSGSSLNPSAYTEPGFGVGGISTGTNSLWGTLEVTISTP